MVAIIKGNVTHCCDSVLCYSVGGQRYRYSRNVVSGSAMIVGCSVSNPEYDS
jgi:hypothetical protein